jgi:hypothetical protein
MLLHQPTGVIVGKKLLAPVLISILLLPIVATQQSFADGLFQHNLPASVGGRDVNLFLQINPPVLTAATQDDAFLRLRLFDAETNETIKFTTFTIQVIKGIDRTTVPLLRDTFHTENGLLTLKIQPRQEPLQVFGTRDNFLNAWKADSAGTVDIRGPLLLESGLYRIRVDVVTVDSIRNTFRPGEGPSFDTFLSVGDIRTEDVQFGGSAYPTTVISHYDRIVDFDFDPETLTYSWSMPFNWDIRRIQNVDAVFVHQEIVLPRSLTGIEDSTVFDARVNGVSITGRMLALDLFSSDESIVVHLLLSRNDIISIAQQIPRGVNTMEFALLPASNGAQQTSGEITTDAGGVLVMIDWTPDQLAAGDESTLELEFYDTFTGDAITDSVTYSLQILDNNGNMAHLLTDQVAQGGTASHTLMFPANENYTIEIEIAAITVEGQAPDFTRSGIARGIVVVPEFPVGAMLATAGVLGSIIALQRLARKTR